MTINDAKDLQNALKDGGKISISRRVLAGTFSLLGLTEPKEELEVLRSSHLLNTADARTCRVLKEQTGERCYLVITPAHNGHDAMAGVFDSDMRTMGIVYAHHFDEA